MKSEFISN